MKVIVDNKIWAAYLLSKDQKVEKFLNLINSKKITLLMSKAILTNLANLLKRPHIKKYLNNETIESFLSLILQKAQIVETHASITNKTSADDQPYANLTATGEAQYIITIKDEFSRFEKLDGFKLINAIELNTFVDNLEA